jgi:hypothetical protein
MGFFYQYAAEPIAEAKVADDQVVDRSCPEMVSDWAIGKEGHNPMALLNVGMGDEKGDPRQVPTEPTRRCRSSTSFTGTRRSKDRQQLMTRFKWVFGARWKYLDQGCGGAHAVRSLRQVAQWKEAGADGKGAGGCQRGLVQASLGPGLGPQAVASLGGLQGEGLHPTQPDQAPAHQRQGPSQVQGPGWIQSRGGISDSQHFIWWGSVWRGCWRGTTSQIRTPPWI